MGCRVTVTSCAVRFPISLCLNAGCRPGFKAGPGPVDIPGSLLACAQPRHHSNREMLPLLHHSFWDVVHGPLELRCRFTRHSQSNSSFSLQRVHNSELQPSVSEEQTQQFPSSVPPTFSRSRWYLTSLRGSGSNFVSVSASRSVTLARPISLSAERY